MSIKEEFVEVNLCSANIKHFENKGYKELIDSLRYFDKHNNRMIIKHGTKMWVRVSDLPPKSAVKITAICECPTCDHPERILKFCQYTDICKDCYNHSEEFRLRHTGENCNWFGNEPYNKGKTLEELHGKEKAKEMKKNHSKKMKGQKHPQSEETKQKISKRNKGKSHPHSRETIEKLRNITINRIEKAKFNGEQFYPNFNRTGCQLIEQYGKENNFNFQHATNGKELRIKGYFPDGYDVERNTIIEIDEPYHENPKQKEKDVIRQKNLIEHLKCDFIRIKVDDNYNILDTIIFKYSQNVSI